MQLKRSVPEYRNVPIPRLGGLRISWNFLKLIGQYNARLWIKCDVDRKRPIRGNTTEHVMAGKDYANAKGTRAHKITLQAMWQLQFCHNY